MGAKLVNLIKKNQTLSIVFIINLFIVSFWLVNNKFFQVHDFTAGARVYELHQAILDGHFPPRWSKNFGFGRGMPLFQFYAPFPFYVAEVFHLVGISILTSIKISYLIATIIGFFSSFYLGRKLTNKQGGLITATVFTLAPYHAVNLYVRGALAEYWAISLMPACLYFLITIFKKPSTKSYLGLTLSLTGILLSHNVTIVTFLPFFGLYFIYLFSINKLKLKKHLAPILAPLHALTISSFFLLPGFFQKSHTRVDTITEGYSQYKMHFIYFRQLFTLNWGYGGSVAGIEDDMSFSLSKIIILLGIIGGLTSLLKITQAIKRKKPIFKYLFCLFTALLFFIAAFSTNYKTQLIWEKISLAKYVQFPWRFLGVTSFLLSILAGYSSLLNPIKKYVAYILSITIIILGFNFRPNQLINPFPLYNPDGNYVSSRVSGIMPDYLPPNVDWMSLKPINEYASSKNNPVIDYKNLPDGEKPKPTTKINLIKNTTDELIVDINSQFDDQITLNRFVFPNWQTYINQQKIDCKITSDSLYQCPVSAGESQIRLVWKEKGINQISNLISLLGIILLIMPVFLKPKFSKSL